MASGRIADRCGTGRVTYSNPATYELFNTAFGLPLAFALQRGWLKL